MLLNQKSSIIWGASLMSSPVFFHIYIYIYIYISGILLWTPSHGQAKVGGPARTYIQQLCADTGCSLEDLPGAMDDRDRWWED